MEKRELKKSCGYSQTVSRNYIEHSLKIIITKFLKILNNKYWKTILKNDIYKNLNKIFLAMN